MDPKQKKKIDAILKLNLKEFKKLVIKHGYKYVHWTQSALDDFDRHDCAPGEYLTSPDGRWVENETAAEEIVRGADVVMAQAIETEKIKRAKKRIELKESSARIQARQHSISFILNEAREKVSEIPKSAVHIHTFSNNGYIFTTANAVYIQKWTTGKAPFLLEKYKAAITDEIKIALDCLKQDSYTPIKS